MPRQRPTRGLRLALRPGGCPTAAANLGGNQRRSIDPSTDYDRNGPVQIPPWAPGAPGAEHFCDLVRRLEKDERRERRRLATEEGEQWQRRYNGPRYR